MLENRGRLEDLVVGLQAPDLGLELADLGQLLTGRPSRVPASTSAWRTQRRTDSWPTPNCRATASHAAVNDGYSCWCSVTSRTALALSCSSIFFGMVRILPTTQKDAAENLGRFMVPIAGLEDCRL
jgi:hypothetical protein